MRASGGPIGTWTEVDDAQLAAKLVELGRLNRWQAEQLKVGRAKFNLGPYQVIDSIGQGGMGQVFKAEHRLMGRIVAIKVLPRHRSTPDAVASFTREIRAQAQFDHQNLVRAFDAGHDGNVYFLVTEYVPGADLRKLVRAHGKLSMQDAATIISQAACGLGHAHRARHGASRREARQLAGYARGADEGLGPGPGRLPGRRGSGRSAGRANRGDGRLPVAGAHRFAIGSRRRPATSTRWAARCTTP